MIALDIESTGLDPERNSILSIGALDTDNPEDQFYGDCRVWEGAIITDEALAINGFSQEEACNSEKQSEAELLKSFITWTSAVSPHTQTKKELIVVGQNSSFDRDFAKAACARAGLHYSFGHRTIDTHSLVWLHMLQKGIVPPKYKEQSGINLTVALEYCGLPPEQKPHNALNGAYAHAEIFSRIAYTKKMLPMYLSYEIPWLIS